MVDEVIIDDQNSVDIDDDVIVYAREVLRRSNEGDEFADDTLCCILHLIAMFIARAEPGWDTEVVEKLERFVDECSTPAVH